MKIKLTPFFFVVCLAYFLMGKGVVVACFLLSALLHEFAHIKVAKIRGYGVAEICLLPYGAVAKTSSALSDKDEKWVSLAGVALNFLLALLCFALWWLIPELYSVSYGFLVANLSIALFNLLPALPLDGGRFLLSISKNKLKALKYLKLSGLFFAFTLFILGIISFFYKPNPSIALAGIFLFYGAEFGVRKQENVTVFSGGFAEKDYHGGVVQKTVAVAHSTPVFKMLAMVKKDVNIEFVVQKENGKKVKFDECELYEICKVVILTDPIGSAYDKYHNIL